MAIAVSRWEGRGISLINVPGWRRKIGAGEKPEWNCLLAGKYRYLRALGKRQARNISQFLIVSSIVSTMSDLCAVNVMGVKRCYVRRKVHKKRRGTRRSTAPESS